MSQDPTDINQNAPATTSTATNTPGEKDASDTKLIDKDDFLLHEYDSLRTEILQRISTRYTILTITLTAFGAAFVIQNIYLPLAFPALALVLMNVYVSNSYGTRKASDFIRNYIEKQVKIDANEKLSDVGWQTHKDAGKSEKQLENKYSAGKVVFFVSSLVASIAGTIFDIQAAPDARIWPGLIVISFAITAFLLLPTFKSDQTLVRWFEDRPSLKK